MSFRYSSAHRRTAALSHGPAVQLIEDDLIVEVLRKWAQKINVSTDSYTPTHVFTFTDEIK